jgi:hypothetical protein
MIIDIRYVQIYGGTLEVTDLDASGDSRRRLGAEARRVSEDELSNSRWYSMIQIITVVFESIMDPFTKESWSIISHQPLLYGQTHLSRFLASSR